MQCGIAAMVQVKRCQCGAIAGQCVGQRQVVIGQIWNHGQAQF